MRYECRAYGARVSFLRFSRRSRAGLIYAASDGAWFDARTGAGFSVITFCNAPFASGAKGCGTRNCNCEDEPRLLLIV